VADQENEQRIRLEQAALANKQQEDQQSANNPEVIRRNKLNQKKQQVSAVQLQCLALATGLSLCLSLRRDNPAL